MLNKIIHFSLQNRLLIVGLAIVVAVSGWFAMERTEVDVFPDLNAPTVVVMTEARGMAAEEVERLVTFPLETAVNGATDVRRVRSSSTNGFSILWVEFDWGTDIYRDRQIVSEKLATAYDQLPKGVGQPTLGPQSSILGEMLIISLTADSTKLMDLRTLADNTLRPRLLGTGGVAQVSVLGGDAKEYQILLHPQRMRHYGVTLSDVMEATEAMNQNTNGGVVNQYGQEYIVRGVVSTTNVEEMSQALVGQSGRVRLSDVATVSVGGTLPRMGWASVEGQSAVLLTVSKQPGAGTIELTEKIERELADLQRAMPADIEVRTDVFRQSRFIESAISNVKSSLLEGAVFVVLILLLFLNNIRTTAISLVTMPLALCITLLVMHAMDLTINTMSLGGMAIAIGSLVDDAIVDVENVMRHLRLNHQLPKEQRRSVKDVVFEASREVRMPILNSTLIIVVSFLPLFFLSGMEGRMLVPLGISFIVSLFASTLVALTLTPVLSSLLLQPGRHADAPRESRVALWLKGGYGKVLHWALGHKRTIMGSTAALLVAAVAVLLSLGNSFLPPFNEGSLTINVSSLPGISLQKSNEIGLRAERLLMQIPEIQTVARKTGRAELDEHALGVNVSEIEAPYELQERSHAEFMDDVRHRLSSIAGANIEIGQPITHRIDAMLSGTRASIAVKLFGNDLGQLYTLANQIKQAAAEVEGITDLNVEQLIERPELQIVPRRELLAQAGISLAEFNRFVNVCLGGEVVSHVFQDGISFPLVVRTDTAYTATIDMLHDLCIDTPGGAVPLSQVADIRSTSGPHTINRENVRRKIVISANASGRDLRGVVNDIRQAVQQQVQLPEGYHVEYGGQFESEQAASQILTATSLLSIALIFLLLYMQFHSARTAGVILLNLPLALIGGVLAIRLTGGDLSIPAIIGFISLFGIATRGGMLLIAQYDHLRAEQRMSLRQSIIHGSMDRLNPILMTALTSALALLPLALQGHLSGNEIQSPMACVILGGLLSSTLLNALVIPIVYEWMNRKTTAKQ